MADPMDEGGADQHAAKRMKKPEEAREEQEAAGAIGGYAAGETGISETLSGPSAGSPTSDLEVDIEDREGSTRPESKPRPRDPDWVAVLRRVGGNSPGSQENLALSRVFAEVKFPASRDDVLSTLGPVAEFHFRVPGTHREIAVDLRHAVSASRKDIYRTMFDIIDTVKDELRRSEKAHHA